MKRLRGRAVLLAAVVVAAAGLVTLQSRHQVEGGVERMKGTVVAGGGADDVRRLMTGRWATDAATARSHLDDPFAGEALADGRVTAREYTQANRRILDCARAKGSDLAIEPRYGLVVFSSSSAAGDTALDQCETQGLYAVRTVYEEFYQDPNGEGDIVHLRCLQRAGLVQTAATDTPGELDQAYARLTAPGSRVPFEEVDRCMYDPQGRS